MNTPLTDEELKEIARHTGTVRKRASAEIRELRGDKQMLLDNSDELETCLAELKADNARLRGLLDDYRIKHEVIDMGLGTPDGPPFDLPEGARP